jgi:hypothetical protein
MIDYDNDDLLDEIAEAKFQRQAHARRMALPPGHPDDPDDQGDSDE